ncbi:hypothetical protein K438DRAFT_1757655 [Mycena galopus ATCC 62051]|nr:hypothetical protein K438DRAFT_1757655 [Mycena galopus ATCC 62051]
MLLGNRHTHSLVAQLIAMELGEWKGDVLPLLESTPTTVKSWILSNDVGRWEKAAHLSPKVGEGRRASDEKAVEIASANHLTRSLLQETAWKQRGKGMDIDGWRVKNAVDLEKSFLPGLAFRYFKSRDQHSRYSALRPCTRLHLSWTPLSSHLDPALPQSLFLEGFRSLTLACFGSHFDSPSAFAYGFGPSRRASAFPAEPVSPEWPRPPSAHTHFRVLAPALLASSSLSSRLLSTADYLAFSKRLEIESNSTWKQRAKGMDIDGWWVKNAVDLEESFLPGLALRYFNPYRFSFKTGVLLLRDKSYYQTFKPLHTQVFSFASRSTSYTHLASS